MNCNSKMSLKRTNNTLIKAQINVQLVRFKHTEEEEMTVENGQAETNGDSSQNWLPFFMGSIQPR